MSIKFYWIHGKDLNAPGIRVTMLYVAPKLQTLEENWLSHRDPPLRLDLRKLGGKDHINNNMKDTGKKKKKKNPERYCVLNMKLLPHLEMSTKPYWIHGKDLNAPGIRVTMLLCSTKIANT